MKYFIKTSGNLTHIVLGQLDKVSLLSSANQPIPYFMSFFMKDNEYSCYFNGDMEIADVKKYDKDTCWKIGDNFQLCIDYNQLSNGNNNDNNNNNQLSDGCLYFMKNGKLLGEKINGDKHGFKYFQNGKINLNFNDNFYLVVFSNPIGTKTETGYVFRVTQKFESTRNQNVT